MINKFQKKIINFYSEIISKIYHRKKFTNTLIIIILIKCDIPTKTLHSTPSKKISSIKKSLSKIYDIILKVSLHTLVVIYAKIITDLGLATKTNLTNVTLFQ